MHKNIKKIKKIKLYYFFLFLISLLILSSIFHNLGKNELDSGYIHYHKNIIIDASYHLRMDEQYKKDGKIRKQLNIEIDKEFWNECKNKTVFSLDIRKPCNFDVFYHYIESKLLLNKLDEKTRQMVIRLHKNSYEKYKNRYIEDFLSVNDNRLTHMLLAAELLNELNESEKKFWILQISRMKFNESQPLFPQTWNRIWIFWRFGFKNHEELTLYGVEDTSQVCAYEPSLQDALLQNVFREETARIINKYTIIKNFCSQKLNESEKEILSKYSPKQQNLNNLYVNTS